MTVPHISDHLLVLFGPQHILKILKNPAPVILLHKKMTLKLATIVNVSNTLLSISSNGKFSFYSSTLYVLEVIVIINFLKKNAHTHTSTRKVAILIFTFVYLFTNNNV